MIMATMAFPGGNDRIEWDHAFKCLVARPLHERLRLERNPSPYLGGRLDNYLAAKTEEEAWKACRRIWKILEDRWEVGVVAAPWIFEMLNNSEVQLGPMSDSALKDRVSLEFKRDPDMWIRRIWRPAKPAFHLFAAYEAIARNLPDELKDPFNPASLKARAPDGIVTQHVARLAMILQDKLTGDPSYRFKREDLAWLDWRESGASFATNR